MNLQHQPMPGESESVIANRVVGVDFFACLSSNQSMSPTRSLLPLLLASVSFLHAAEPASPAPTNRPNILVIFTDQQNTSMMSCTGNPNLKTPNLDGLAAKGARFELASIAPFQFAATSRFSMITGVMPCRVGMETNHEQSTGSM